MIGRVALIAAVTLSGCAAPDEAHYFGGSVGDGGGGSGGGGAAGSGAGAGEAGAGAAPSSGGAAQCGGAGGTSSDPGVANTLMAVLDGVAATWAPDTAALVGYLAVPWDYTESTAHELEISLQPNSCYTFVAAGLPPVSEVNIRIMQSTFILAQDQDIGAQAVLGKKPYCYKNAFAYPVKVRAVLEVAQGCGVAAAALYVAP